jgi:histidine ammonia-lyase
VIAIEVLSATEALEFHKPIESGPGVRAAANLVRSVVPPLEADRIMTGDLAAVRDLIVSRSLRDAVEGVVGPLH